jgi:hypothetical protein
LSVLHSPFGSLHSRGSQKTPANETAARISFVAIGSRRRTSDAEEAASRRASFGILFRVFIFSREPAAERRTPVPEYFWHKDEFAAEEDFHSALEHVIVSRFGLYIERCLLEEIWRADIYIPFIYLFLEVKLISSMWRRDSVAEQSLRYSEIEDTIIVSLDGDPAYWTEAPPVPWINPEELFSFLSEILELEE